MKKLGIVIYDRWRRCAGVTTEAVRGRFWGSVRQSLFSSCKFVQIEDLSTGYLMERLPGHIMANYKEVVWQINPRDAHE